MRKVEASARAVVRPIRRAGHPLVGIHVRRTDYIKKVATRFKQLRQYSSLCLSVWSHYLKDNINDSPVRSQVHKQLIHELIDMWLLDGIGFVIDDCAIIGFDTFIQNWGTEFKRQEYVWL